MCGFRRVRCENPGALRHLQPAIADRHPFLWRPEGMNFRHRKDRRMKGLLMQLVTGDLAWAMLLVAVRCEITLKGLLTVKWNCR
jgi:hypothetical protein